MSGVDPLAEFLSVSYADGPKVDAWVREALVCQKVDVEEFLRGSYDSLQSVLGANQPLHNKLFVVIVALMVSQKYNQLWRDRCAEQKESWETFQVHVNNTILRLFYRLNANDVFSTGPDNVVHGHIVNAVNHLRLLMDMGCLTTRDLSMNTEYI